MEFLFLLLVTASGVGGVACRRWLGTAVGRYLMRLGLAALGLGLLILGLTVLGTGLVGTWTAGLGSVFLLLLAAAVLPFAIALVTGRRWANDSATTGHGRAWPPRRRGAGDQPSR